MNELMNELDKLMKFMKLVNARMQSLGKEYTTHRMHMIYDTNKCSLSVSRDLQIAFVTEAQVEFSEETAEIACGWPKKITAWRGKAGHG